VADTQVNANPTFKPYTFSTCINISFGVALLYVISLNGAEIRATSKYQVN